MVWMKKKISFTEFCVLNIDLDSLDCKLTINRHKTTLYAFYFNLCDYLDYSGDSLSYLTSVFSSQNLSTNVPIMYERVVRCSDLLSDFITRLS